jgi:iron complex outermembrane receptor protein
MRAVCHNFDEDNACRSHSNSNIGLVLRCSMRRFGLLSLLATLLTSPAFADTQQDIIFRDPSFEQLASVRVVSVAKTEQPHFTTAAAIHVITAGDIRRNGARSIPEALRLAPGVEVARIGSHRYAITIRGFNGEFANKLLVMMDGRSLYSPILAGTFWDVPDTFIEDIERIEVVRGPGGTAWGVNAVNGVINIITRDAYATQGIAVLAGGGDEERAYGGLRYGDRLGERAAYRVYAKAFERDAALLSQGVDAGDKWRQTRVGFRLDGRASEQDGYLVDGDAFHSRADQVIFNLPDTVKLSGGHVRGRWQRAGTHSDSSVQLVYDTTRRDSGQGVNNQQDVDFDALHARAAGKRHTFTSGLSARYAQNETIGGPGLVYSPKDRDLFFGSMFFDVAAVLQPDRWRTSAGLKFEHNQFTGLETLPNLRVAFTPSMTQTLWAAASRGLRIPSITDNDATNAIGRVSFPNRDLPPERLHAFELGWRAQWAGQIATDLAIFEHRYARLRSRETAFDSDLNELVAVRSDRRKGRANGAEATATWRPDSRWRVQASYSYLNMDLALHADSNDISSLREAGNSPRHQARLSVFFPVFKRHELSLAGRYVDQLPTLTVPAYTELDAHWIWTVTPALEVRVSGRNLLNESHLEYRPSNSVPRGGEVERSGYLGVYWRR